MLKEKALKQNVSTSVTLSTAVTTTKNATTTTTTTTATAAANTTHTSLMLQRLTANPALEKKCKNITMPMPLHASCLCICIQNMKYVCYSGKQNVMMFYICNNAVITYICKCKLG